MSGEELFEVEVHLSNNVYLNVRLRERGSKVANLRAVRGHLSRLYGLKLPENYWERGFIVSWVSCRWERRQLGP